MSKTPLTYDRRGRIENSLHYERWTILPSNYKRTGLTSGFSNFVSFYLPKNDKPIEGDDRR